MTIEEENVKSFLSNWGLQAKPCDYCKTTAALIFCRIDSAFLCVSCDTRIHIINHNKLSSTSRHERVWMCEVCEQAPASVTCKADAANLCVTCDQDIHSANPVARRHDRVPIVPFFDSAAEVIAKYATPVPAATVGGGGRDDSFAISATDVDSWLIPNPNGKMSTEFLFSDPDPFVEFGYPTTEMKIEQPSPDNFVVNKHNCNNKMANDSVVPNQQQKSTSISFSFNENCCDIDFTQSKLNPFNYSSRCISSEVGVVPDRGNSNSLSETSDFTKSMTTSSGNNSSGSVAAMDGSAVAAIPAVQLSRRDREARVMRYREKRKNRKFQKTIRYASRKAYAETRPRIKGRFAKRNEMDMMMMDNGSGNCEVDQTNFGNNVNGSHHGDSFLFDHGGYGVVTSF